MTYRPPAEWEPEQSAIIEAPPGAWTIVEAGPGTGKTAVACARVNHMLRAGIRPSGILLISFTRAAVSEVRQRMTSLAETSSTIAAVRVSTIDSEAWRLGTGYLPQDSGRMARGYDANISDVLELVRRRDPDLMDFLSSCRHLIVDEAQDLMGLRTDFIAELLRAMPPECGVTVFADPAQAIYGFTSDADDDGAREQPLSARIQELIPGRFQRKALTRVHRTDDRKLLDLFHSARDVTLGDQAPSERLSRLKTVIQEQASGQVEALEDLDLGRDDLLVLYRRRMEVLMASSFLSQAGHPHRLRMSGLPVAIHPWVAYIFAGWPERTMSRSAFGNAWARPENPAHVSKLVEEASWRLLLRFAGTKDGSAVEVAALRRVLAQGRPPVEFCMTECGLVGPILGTIHASKGREADNVCLMLPKGKVTSAQPEELEEESRVLYVGATRARRRVHVGEGYLVPARSLPSGRVYRTFHGKAQAQVEFGLDGDIDVASCVSRRVHSTERQALRLQQSLLKLVATPERLGAFSSRESNFIPQVSILLEDETEGQILASMSKGVNSDLWEIAHHLESLMGGGTTLRPPERIPHLVLQGVRTAVLGEDHPALEDVHAPFARNGFFLAPLVKGFSTIYFRYMKKGASR